VSTIEIVLLSATPILLSCAATVLVWRRISRPFLFACVSLLVLFGIDGLVRARVTHWLLPPLGCPADSRLIASPQMIAANVEHAMLIVAASVIVCGLPLLYWIYLALRKSP
jgi:hypothetical protein